MVGSAPRSSAWPLPIWRTMSVQGVQLCWPRRFGLGTAGLASRSWVSGCRHRARRRRWPARLASCAAKSASMAECRCCASGTRRCCYCARRPQGFVLRLGCLQRRSCPFCSAGLVCAPPSAAGPGAVSSRVEQRQQLLLCAFHCVWAAAVSRSSSAVPGGAQLALLLRRAGRSSLVFLASSDGQAPAAPLL